MKKGKYFLKYLFTMAFCFLASGFFSTFVVHAENQFTCYDNKNHTQSCDVLVEDGYAIINRFEVTDEKTITLPSDYKGFIVKELAKDAIVSVNGIDLDLDKIILPEHLFTIKTGAFNHINSLKEMTFPKSLFKIETRIFKNNAHIEKIYLNHREVDVQDGAGVRRDSISFDLDAFSNIDLNVFRLYAGNMDIYTTLTEEPSISENLVGVKITTPITYNYHKYANYNKDELLASETYYIGEGFTISNVPEILDIEQLNFVKWFSDLDKEIKIENNQPVFYVPGEDVYNIYPKFELKDFEFNIIDNGLVKEYNSSKDLITMNLDVESLNLPIGINYTMKWYKYGKNNEKEFVKQGNTLSLYRYNDSGVYACEFNYSFIDQDGTEYIKKNPPIIDKVVDIKRHTLNVKTNSVSTTYGTYLNRNDINYQVDGLLGEDIIPEEGITLEYPYSGDIQAGFYLGTLKTMIIMIKNNQENVINNYNIIYTNGDYIVHPKRLDDIAYNESIEIEYGQPIVMERVINDSAYGYNNVIKITFKREKGNNVGTYKVIGIDSISNDNYIVNFDYHSLGKVIIIPKKVELNFKVYYTVYDKKEKETELYYMDIHNQRIDLTPIYRYKNENVTSVVNAGHYIVINNDLGDSNYIRDYTKQISFDISKAVPKVSYNANPSYIYTGDVIFPTYSIDNDEQEPIYTYMQNGYIISPSKNVGNYMVDIKFKETDNYLEFNTSSRESIRLSISKYPINLNPKEFEVYYGDDINLEEKINVNGENVVIKYFTDADKLSDIGSYDIKRVSIYDENGFYEHPNYKGQLLISECKDKVKVVSRPVSINYYNYTDLIYDGNNKNIGAYLVDNITNKVVKNVDLTVFAYEGDIKNAGNYHINVKFDDPHYLITNTSLQKISIAKADYDLSNIKFYDRQFFFNFKNHYMNIDGQLPNGVSVKYTIDDKEGNKANGFNHIVTANFIVDEQNYNPIESISAYMKIDMTWLFTTIICLIIAIGIGVCASLLYSAYRREHPRKIKLKIKNIVDEDLAAKRVATSVKEVLGDTNNNQKEIEIIEDENDLVNDKDSTDSFIERIYAANSELKYYYSEVKNELLSYEGITHTVDRKYEVFYHGNKMVAKLSICNHILRLYVNLDPNKYSKEEYNHKDMSQFECHSMTPLRINVDSLESLRHAKVFIRIIRKHEKLEAVSGFARVDYEKFYTLKEKILPDFVKGLFKTRKTKKTNKK